ncbi:hypothetical protein Tco_0338951, partial [Tanacetum coccineum]
MILALICFQSLDPILCSLDQSVITRIASVAKQYMQDVIRVQYDQGHGQEFIKEFVVKRADGEYESFSKSDY